MSWQSTPVTTQQGVDVNIAVWNDGTRLYQGERQTDVLGHHVVSTASVNAANVKATPGRLRGLSLFNAGGQVAYIKFHNVAGAPSGGSGVVRTYAVQAGVRLDVLIPGGGLLFSIGIGRTIVRGPADSDNAPIGVNEIIGEVYYE